MAPRKRPIIPNTMVIIKDKVDRFIFSSKCNDNSSKLLIYYIKTQSKMQYWDNLVSILRSTQPRFSPEWVRIWVGSLLQILRPTFSRRKRKKRPEISRFQVFYGCGGRTRTCGLRVMSCSEASIPCTAKVLHLFCPRKSGKTRRPEEFAPRRRNGLSRKWVGIWVRADSGVSRNGTLKQRSAHSGCSNRRKRSKSLSYSRS